MSAFKPFAQKVNARFTELAATGKLFTVSTPSLYEDYLAAYPAGSNPIFRERTEHDCQCCKHFIRNIGNVVAIVSGKLKSVWDIDTSGLEPHYAAVARAMKKKVESSPIEGVFATKFPKFGAEATFDNKDPEIKWHHFYADVPRAFIKDSPGAAIGKANAITGVFQRGLEQFTREHIDSVIELIEANTLYRGAEFLASLKGFRVLLSGYEKAKNKNLFVWANAGDGGAGIRNTVIGTLLIDLAEGKELERAVAAYESKVAPANYKRTSAVITQGMIEQATKKIRELGLEDALERRFAKTSDLSVNDVLYVNAKAATKMKGSILDSLQSAVKPVTIKNTTEISIDDFLKANFKNIEVVVEPAHLGNFVSLTAPAHEDSGRLFKWDNGFAWSYDGEVTDSIKDRVQKAGGNVTDALLRCSLAWNNFDDLDIHAYTPRGEHIFYMNKSGVLDVDMNAGGGRTREPVENLSWRSIRDGEYTIKVHNFCKREDIDVGFTVQLEFNGKVSEFTYSKPVRNHEMVEALKLRFQAGQLVGVTPGPGMSGAVDLKVEKWGVTTGVPVPVETILHSPNFWEGSGEVGNKHTFFILKDCKNPDPARGIYNEFLRGDLEPHRKVFEVLASRTKCQPTDDQLSGVGFSWTQRATLTAIGDGRPFTITF